MTDPSARLRFEALLLPHLDAAFNLARWLVRNDHDAEDVVQEAFLRAWRYFASFRGEQARAWLLQIVRHTAYAWLERHRPARMDSLDAGGGDDDEGAAFEPAAPPDGEPLAVAIRNADRALVNRAIAALPVAFREVVVLRELEDLAYRDIARIAGVPVGTVMSRLSRGRALLQRALCPEAKPPQPVLREVRTATERGRRP